jgi:acyl carrier protein
MDNIEQRVKKIVAEQLGVPEADIKNETLLTLLNWSWL